MPNFDAATFLRPRGVNPLKSMRRAADGLSLLLKNNGNEYRHLSDRKARFFYNKKHVHRGAACVRAFAAKKKGPSFFSYVPTNYDKYPDHVKFGYYMHPEITDAIVNEFAGEFVNVAGAVAAAQIAAAANEGKKISAEKLTKPNDYPLQALHHFRSLLRGEECDLSWAVLGANMILKYEGDRQDLTDPDKPSSLPQELCDLAYRLSKANSRISVGWTPPPLEEDSVRGKVMHAPRREVGDVRVKRSTQVKDDQGADLEVGEGEELLKKLTQEPTEFHTKRIDPTRTRHRFLSKKRNSNGATQAKLRAAYQSIYHAVSKESSLDRNNPYYLELKPLYGGKGDDSSIRTKRNKKIDDKTVKSTLAQAARAVTINDNLNIFFECGESYEDFRRSFRKELEKTFPPNAEKAVRLEKDTSEAGSDVGIHPLRSVADRASNSTAKVHSKKNRAITKMAVNPGKESTKAELDIGRRKPDFTEGRSLQSNGMAPTAEDISFADEDYLSPEFPTDRGEGLVVGNKFRPGRGAVEKAAYEGKSANEILENSVTKIADLARSLGRWNDGFESKEIDSSRLLRDIGLLCGALKKYQSEVGSLVSSSGTLNAEIRAANAWVERDMESLNEIYKWLSFCISKNVEDNADELKALRQDFVEILKVWQAKKSQQAERSVSKALGKRLDINKPAGAESKSKVRKRFKEKFLTPLVNGLSKSVTKEEVKKVKFVKGNDYFDHEPAGIPVVANNFRHNGKPTQKGLQESVGVLSSQASELLGIWGGIDESQVVDRFRLVEDLAFLRENIDNFLSEISSSEYDSLALQKRSEEFMIWAKDRKIYVNKVIDALVQGESIVTDQIELKKQRNRFINLIESVM